MTLFIVYNLIMQSIRIWSYNFYYKKNKALYFSIFSITFCDCHDFYEVRTKFEFKMIIKYEYAFLVILLFLIDRTI